MMEEAGSPFTELAIHSMGIYRSIRSFLPLAIGLVVGGTGAILFQDSLPREAGSPEEQVDRLEVELKEANHRIAALEAASEPQHKSVFDRVTGPRRTDSGRALADGARRIAEDIRAGRAVNPEEIFRASQPLMRDLAPLFERIQIKQQQRIIDSITGELARKYDLTPSAAEALHRWFQEQSNERAKRWTEFVARDDTRMEDLILAAHEMRPDEGLDAFMPSILSGEKLASFQAERWTDRVQRVQQEADMRMNRLDTVVRLDDAQRDQVFGIFARNSRDYDPAMGLQGVLGPIGPTPAGDRPAAILSVLRPEQRTAYEAERERRRAEATAEMESVGLSLPPGWEMLDDDFR